ncbi:hypothetical protein VNI00_007600 [Paramarasmius palmivorus]|uniref:Uncharacterized protein n=1 Tax=Paramarasmius palmivorus TaxID=297713 RepID=A0AAW0D016_9AGAR
MPPAPSSLELSMASEVQGQDLLFESTDASTINALDTDEDSEEEWEEVQLQPTPLTPTHDAHRTTPTAESTPHPTVEVGEDEEDNDLLELELELEQGLAEIDTTTPSPEADEPGDNEAPSRSHSLAELTPPSPPKSTSTTDKSKVESTSNDDRAKASTPSSATESCRVKRARKNKEKKASLLPPTSQPKPDAVAPSVSASSSRVVKEAEIVSSSKTSTRPKTHHIKNQILGKRKNIASSDITFTKETVAQIVHHAVLLTFERGNDVPPIDERETWKKLLDAAVWRLYTHQIKDRKENREAMAVVQKYMQSDLTVLLDNPSLGLSQETIELCARKLRAQGVVPTPRNTAAPAPATPSANFARDTGSASMSPSTSQSSAPPSSGHMHATQRVQGMDRNFSFDMRDQRPCMLPDRVEGPPYRTRHVPPPPPRLQSELPPWIAHGPHSQPPVQRLQAGSLAPEPQNPAAFASVPMPHSYTPFPTLGYGSITNGHAFVPPAHGMNHPSTYQQPRMIPINSSMPGSTRRSPYPAQYAPVPLLQQHAGNPGARQAANYQQPRHIGPNLVPYSATHMSHNQDRRNFPSTANQYPRSARVQSSHRTSASGVTSQAGPSTRRQAQSPPVAPQEPQLSTVTAPRSGTEPMIIQFKLAGGEMREGKRRKY